MSIPRKTDPPEWCAHECGFCGTRGGQYLTHYQILRCSCGKFYWTLRPKRGGPLKLFPHPTLNQTGIAIPAD